VGREEQSDEEKGASEAIAGRSEERSDEQKVVSYRTNLASPNEDEVNQLSLRLLLPLITS